MWLRLNKSELRHFMSKAKRLKVGQWQSARTMGVGAPHRGGSSLNAPALAKLQGKFRRSLGSLGS